MGKSSPSGRVRVGLTGLVGYLEATRDFERNVKLFLTATAFRGMTIATLQTVFNLYLYSLHYDARSIGAINGVNSIAILLTSVPLGFVTDRIGRRPVLLVGGIAYPMTILALSLATSTPAIMVFNFLFGSVAAAYWVAGVPLLYASTREHQRVQVFSVNSFLLWGLGPFGALLGGLVVEGAAGALQVNASSTEALRVGMFFMTGLAAAGSVPYFFLRDSPRRRETRQAESPPLGRVAALLGMLLVPDLVLTFGLGGVLTFIQLYFHLRFHLDAGPIGAVVAVAGVAAGIATLSTPVLARRWGNLKTAVRAQWLAAPMIGVLAISHQLGLAVVVYCLVLMLRGMADPVYTAFVQERVPEVYRARATGLYSVTYSIGYSLGPALSGAIQKGGGFTPAFLVGGTCYLAGSTLLYLFFSRSERNRMLSDAYASGQSAP